MRWSKKLNEFLGFENALSTEFKVQRFTGKAGIGDSTVHSRSGKLLSSTGSEYVDMSSPESKMSYNNFLKQVSE